MRTATVLAAALAAASPLSAQQVLLRMKPPQGQVTHYVMVTETFMQGGPMAQMAADPNAPLMRMTIHQTSTVTAQGGEEYTVSQVLDSARMEFPAMPQMDDMAGQMGDMMRGTATVSRMTSRGRVLALEMTPSAGMKEMMGNAEMGGGGAFGGGSGGNSFPSFWLLPADPVRVGESWRDSMTVALDSAGVAGAGMTLAATFTLVRMEGHAAVIGVNGTVGTSGGAMPAAMTFAVTGEVRLDIDAGREAGMTAEMSGTAPTPMGDVPMKVRITMTAQ